MISFFSFLVVVAGVMHLLPETFPVPHKGLIYSIILMGLAVLMIIGAIINNLLMGFEKFVLIIEGILLLGIGALPFLSSILPFMPTEGIFYGAMVIVLGIAGLLYGLLGMG